MNNILAHLPGILALIGTLYSHYGHGRWLRRLQNDQAQITGLINDLRGAANWPAGKS